MKYWDGSKVREYNRWVAQTLSRPSLHPSAEGDIRTDHVGLLAQHRSGRPANTRALTGQRKVTHRGFIVPAGTVPLGRRRLWLSRAKVHANGQGKGSL